MEKSKLVILLRTFDVWEMRSLREMVESPFFNKQEIVVRLMEEVERSLRKGELVPEMEVIHKRLWPDLEYDHQRLRYVMTDLTRLVEEFLVQQQLERRSALQSRLLLEGLAERKQEKFFGQNFAKALEKLEKDGLRDADYHHERFRMHEIGLSFEQTRSEKSNYDWLHPMIDDLQYFFWSTRLRAISDLVSRSGDQLSGEDKAMVDELRKRLGKLHGSQLPAVAMYETVLQMLTHPDAELYYRKLRMNLRGQANQFSKQELAHLYNYALNFAIQQLNRGVEAYLQEILLLYREQLGGQILRYDGVFPIHHFKNIVTVGLRLKEYDWTRKFIAEESTYLPVSERDPIIVYSNAALHYVLGEYAACRKALQFATFADISYELDGKILLMKSLYELADWKALNALGEKQLKFIAGNPEATARQRNFHMNFVRFLLRLVQFRQGSRAPLGALIGEIEATREASDLKWLRLKVDEAAAM